MGKKHIRRSYWLSELGKTIPAGFHYLQIVAARVRRQHFGNHIPQSTPKRIRLERLLYFPLGFVRPLSHLLYSLALKCLFLLGNQLPFGFFLEPICFYLLFCAETLTLELLDDAAFRVNNVI
jgi:hypothetical protein